MNGKYDYWKYRRKDRSHNCAVVCVCRHLCWILPPPLHPSCHSRAWVRAWWPWRRAAGPSAPSPHRAAGEATEKGDGIPTDSLHLRRSSRGPTTKSVGPSIPQRSIDIAPFPPTRVNFLHFWIFHPLCPPFGMHCEITTKRLKKYGCLGLFSFVTSIPLLTEEGEGESLSTFLWHSLLETSHQWPPSVVILIFPYIFFMKSKKNHKHVYGAILCENYAIF